MGVCPLFEIVHGWKVSGSKEGAVVFPLLVQVSQNNYVVAFLLGFSYPVPNGVGYVFVWCFFAICVFGVLMNFVP